jgi:hypothetical protein
MKLQQQIVYSLPNQATHSSLSTITRLTRHPSPNLPTQSQMVYLRITRQPPIANRVGSHSHAPSNTRESPTERNNMLRRTG